MKNLTKTSFVGEGLSELSSDEECSRIGLTLGGPETEDLAIYWRDKLREEFESRIVYRIKNGDDPSFCEEYGDLDSALSAAYDLAYLMAVEKREADDDDEPDIDFYSEGDFDWGACPAGDDGAYWPYIEAYVDGEKIEKLPWS